MNIPRSGRDIISGVVNELRFPAAAWLPRHCGYDSYSTADVASLQEVIRAKLRSGFAPIRTYINADNLHQNSQLLLLHGILFLSAAS